MPGARHFTELIIWQLADQVREQVFALTRKHPFVADFKLRSQIDDAADSVCRNIAEGFGCKSDKEFARFVRIGRRSLNEVQDGFRSALLKGHVTDSDLVPARPIDASSLSGDFFVSVDAGPLKKPCTSIRTIAPTRDSPLAPTREATSDRPATETLHQPATARSHPPSTARSHRLSISF